MTVCSNCRKVMTPGKFTAVYIGGLHYCKPSCANEHRQQTQAARHHRCATCHTIQPETAITMVDENIPVCNQGGCKDAYYRKTLPRSTPRSLGFYYNG